MVEAILRVRETRRRCETAALRNHHVTVRRSSPCGEDSISFKFRRLTFLQDAWKVLDIGSRC